MEYLHAAIERIDHQNLIVVVNEQPGRKLKFAGIGSRAPEVIEQFDPGG